MVAGVVAAAAAAAAGVVVVVVVEKQYNSSNCCKIYDALFRRAEVQRKRPETNENNLVE